MNFVLEIQRFDMLEQIGKNDNTKTLFIPMDNRNKMLEGLESSHKQL